MTTLVSPLGVNKTIEPFQVEGGMTRIRNGSGEIAGKEIFLMDLRLLGWSLAVSTTYNLRNVTSGLSPQATTIHGGQALVVQG